METINITKFTAEELTNSLSNLAHQVKNTAISFHHLNQVTILLKPVFDMYAKRESQNKLIRKRFRIKQMK